MFYASFHSVLLYFCSLLSLVGCFAPSFTHRSYLCLFCVPFGSQSLFGPEWYNHALLVITHADHLKEAELNPPVYLSRTTDWLRALAEKVSGGVCFLDNCCDWPSIRGRPLRDRLLNLSAKNHHQALRVRTEVSLWHKLWSFLPVKLKIISQRR